MTPLQPHAPSPTIAVAGLGNIGSQVVPLLAGLPWLERALLCDFDRYEARNSGKQRFSPGHVGKAKAHVQARVLRALAPHLSVEAHCCRIEHAPLGTLRAAMILSCVDSRAARQSINRIAFALGIAWIDAALNRDGSIRARAYLPGHGDCLECNWAERDYELIEQRVPCETKASASSSSATAAPMEFGAMAAAMQVSILRSLEGNTHAAPEVASRQWFIDAPTGRGWTATYSANPDCRLSHAPWTIATVAQGPDALRVRDALALADDAPGESALGAPGHEFIQRVRCARCNRVRRTGRRLSGRMLPVVCKSCATPMIPSALDATEFLSARELRPAYLDRTLAEFGFRAGDIIALRGQDKVSHFLLSDPT